ncbi:hypothetical protein BLOT_016225 [Blomia tropicalis]|nr:hypothetical protein BLOT_016225 [Blomia tropicalis]
MSQNILIDGKPLHLLRVVDLRDELKKRGIKTTGTKAHLQELLISALQSAGEVKDNQPEVIENDDEVENVDKDDEESEDSPINTNDQKVASLSINEESRTIKLSIRNSPRKSEPPPQVTDSETSESNDSVETSGSYDKDDHVDDDNNVSVADNENSANENICNDKDDLNDQVESDKSTKFVDEPIQKEVSIPESVTTASSEDTSKESNDLQTKDQIEHTTEESGTDDNVGVEKQQSSVVEETNFSKPVETESKNRTSIRGRLLSHSKSIVEDGSATKPTQRKRRWGGSNSNDSSMINKGISSDALKQLINESIVNEPDTAAISTKVTLMILKTIAKSAVPNSSENESRKSITETDVPTRDTISPAKNPVSSVLFVTGLVRPYTLPQLKKLLSANGTIDEEKFWIDKIKSKCYVVFSTNEEAVKTREALHHLKWPQSSPKSLSVEFATLEDIDRCINPENYEDLPPKTKQISDQNKSNETKVIEKRDVTIDIGKGKYDIIQNEPIRPSTKNSNTNEDFSRNVREWDRNKVTRPVLSRKENEDEEHSRKRARHSSMSPSGKNQRERSKTPELKRRKTVPVEMEPTSKESGKRSETPQKLLEDLFRKTKAFPFLYWLPLTEEQIIEKEKHKVIVERERQERIARREAEPKRENISPNRPPPQHMASYSFKLTLIITNNIQRERYQKFQNYRRRSISPQRGRKRSLSPSPRHFSRHSRSRSPDRRRFSPRRRR